MSDKKCYELQYRESGEQMLWSESYDHLDDAEYALEQVKFKGKCNVVELWEFPEEIPDDTPAHFVGELLDTKYKP